MPRNVRRVSTRAREFSECHVWYLDQYTIHRTKKMAGLHFTTISCKPNAANREYRRDYVFLGGILTCTINIVLLGLKFLELLFAFLWAFYKGFLALRIMDKSSSRHLFSYVGLDCSFGLSLAVHPSSPLSLCIAVQISCYSFPAFIDRRNVWKNKELWTV